MPFIGICARKVLQQKRRRILNLRHKYAPESLVGSDVMAIKKTLRTGRLNPITKKLLQKAHKKHVETLVLVHTLLSLRALYGDVRSKKIYDNKIKGRTVMSYDEFILWSQNEIKYAEKIVSELDKLFRIRHSKKRRFD